MATTTLGTERLTEPYSDLGNLLLIDKDPIDQSTTAAAANISEEQLRALAKRNCKQLFDEIWKLPRKIVQDATCAQLPECGYTLPREKPIPKAKEPTKWEKFARAKGIVKKKRSKKVWDEGFQDWKPRYGYRKANDTGKDWLIEIPDQQNPYKDYFAEKSKEKVEKKGRQEFQRLRNVASKQPAAQINKSLGLVPTAEKSREQLIHQIDRAKVATASLGKFQQAMKGELRPKNTGEKKKFDPNEGKENLAVERERQMKILQNLQAKKPKLMESRVNAVGEHIKKERRMGNRGSDKSPSGKKGRGRGAARSHSQIDRQQKFQRFKKQTSKSKFEGRNSKGGKSKAGKRK